MAGARDFEVGIAGPDITTCMPNIGGGFASFLGRVRAGGAARLAERGVYAELYEVQASGYRN